MDEIKPDVFFKTVYDANNDFPNSFTLKIQEPHFAKSGI